jgi:hypothetical protein
MFPAWATSDEIERDIPAIRQLREYWESLNGGNPPERNQIDPEQITSLLPYMLLVDFESDPFRVRYRLTGTQVDQDTGYNLTGRYLDEFLEEPFQAVREGVSQLHQAYQQAWGTGLPIIGAYAWSPGPLSLKMPIGIFPIAVQGKVVQAIAIEQTYKPSPYFETKTWKDHLALHAEAAE